MRIPLYFLLIAAAVALVACTPLPGPASQQNQIPLSGIGGAMGGGMMRMTPITSEYLFLREMVPHHQEAVDTAKLTLQTTENPELKALLQSIITAQEREIVMMDGWLGQWYANNTTRSSYQPMMGDLSRLSGKQRDVAFLNGMIMHHQMAVGMATSVLSLQPREEVKQLALGIVESQTAEIGQMRTMLIEDYGQATSCGANCPMMGGGMMR